MKAFWLSKRSVVTAAVTSLALLGMAAADMSAETKPAKKRGWIGVSVQELTPSLRDAMELGNRSGLLINEVVANSPADDAGLREEDVLLEFNGKKVERVDRLSELVRDTEPRTEVQVKIFRDGEEKTLSLTVGRLRTRGAGVYSFGGGDNVFMLNRRAMLGVQVHDVNEDLAPYFNVGKNEGVLILKVEEDSPAEAAGLKAGDVIVKIDGDNVRDYEEMIDILSYYEDGEKADIEYIRKGKNQQVAVELHARDNNAWGLSLPEGRHFNWRFFERDGKRIHVKPPEVRHRIRDSRDDVIILEDRLQDDDARYRFRIRDGKVIKLRDMI